MAMSILNNTATMAALGESNKNLNKLGKVIKQAASGMKLNSTGDGASEYAISEKMRVNIRSLNQDDQNVQNGRALLNVAEGGMQSIVDELRRLKELAVDSANGHHSDFDRAILQREFEERKAVIDEVVATTNYNGKILLDGTYRFIGGEVGSVSFSEVDFSLDPKSIIEEHEKCGEELVKSTDLPVTGYTKETRPAGAASFTTSGSTITITSSGTFEIPSGFTGSIEVNAGNVELDGAGRTYDNVNIKTSSSNTNIWLKDINIISNTDDAVIQFTGSGNNLLLLGNNTINSTNNMYEKPAIIDVGDELTINNGSSTSEGTLRIKNRNGNQGGKAGIGSGLNPSACVNIESGTMAIHTTYGAAIGSSISGKMGDINITGGHILADTIAGAAVIGSGTIGMPIDDHDIVVGDINISGDAIVDVAAWWGAGIGEAAYDAARVPRSKAGNITIESPNVRAFSYRSDAVGSGLGQDTSSGRVGTDRFGYAIYAVEEINDYPNTIDVVGKYDIPYNMKGRDSYHLYAGGGSSSGFGGKQADTKLIIHTGTESSQNLRMYINDMGTKAMKLDKIAIDPMKEAIKALAPLDKALEYALDEVTTVGAYNSRLVMTSSNIVSATGNVTAAESVIRDADMASVMTEYAKNNILSQAAQSMLSQANQNSSQVLSLLQG